MMEIKIMDIEKEKQRIEGDPSLAAHEKKAALEALSGSEAKKSLFSGKKTKKV